MRKRGQGNLFKWILALVVFTVVAVYIKSSNLVMFYLLASLFTGGGFLLVLIRFVQGYGMDPTNDGFWASLIRPNAAKPWQRIFLLFTGFGLLVISATFAFLYSIYN